jgi:hypothetical protein
MTLPGSVTVIGESAFTGCTSLTSVNIPDSVISIGVGAFTFCDSLNSVTIGNSVASIGRNAFTACTSLTSVTFKGTIPPDMFSDGNVFPGDLRAKYLAGGIGTYTRADPASGKWTKQ